ncbi:DUF1697 domain-containing protein [Nocardia wallacei]|uniref:DUF1697 domain-containing protein n=1 Tax=Nocardia wallacei TaxID=480035 RepID=A0A7G1KGC8_9NOCA|nr:DUF1697 domain-containing protein [Nocardia wallacei]BCK54165.1 hypothetical protein NWFMUON74_19370 [Nocardia wallacei]
MHRYAALLRGIMPSNPNMRNEKLRGVFEGLGFDAVGSVLSSGNIVFGSAESDAAALESRIQKALNAELGIGGGTILRSREELRALVDSDPFPGLTHGRGTYLTVTFLKDRTAAAPDALPAELAAAVRIVGYDEAAAAVLAVIDNTASTTPNHMAWLESVYGKDITTRTWLTVRKVLAKL